MRRLRLCATVLFALTLLGAVGVGSAMWRDGYRLYAVRTGSMTPTYPTGGVVLDAPARPHRLAHGNVITFQTVNGLVTHRIVGTTKLGFITKGDANRTADVGSVSQRHVLGRVVAGTAFGGYLLVFAQQPEGLASLALLLVSSYLAWSIFFDDTSSSEQPAALHRRRRHWRGLEPPLATEAADA